ncbi:hypothetical protein [Natronoglycomyces albus]|uniref:Uncharacterized protein n=1 Tax=Natronoglycomyces albus TaxID=2811108 RepID=A0A895Y014_9ACTN|nr:hypothetical protein [Natronoglycomyces albus]QSB07158.1 hypothetical protein JQS30_17095 [Natronoglycomyces albus]
MDMNPLLKPHEEAYAYILPLRRDHAEQLDLMDWQLVDAVHSTLIAIAKGRAGESMDTTDVGQASKLTDYVEEVHNEIVVRAADEGMTHGQRALAMDVPRSTAQTQLKVARSRKWKRGWLLNAADRAAMYTGSDQHNDDMMAASSLDGTHDCHRCGTEHSGWDNNCSECEHSICCANASADN